ncbi:XAC2610-related protein [Chryseobacterium indologenes]|uniref:XAC2610-related protein n=1 Tax=Chryseobacterium indologenes TaxID=253 RepID=UPI0022E5ADF6|nr:hypothetical protein [Chryseobacterium indologenes]
MRNIIFIVLVIFSGLSSCKKTNNLANTRAQKNLKNFLKIPLLKNEDVFIGELSTINDSLHEDFTIKETQDSIFVFQNFLESDNFDGKEILVEKQNPIKQIDLKYKIALFFNGTEKENKFIPLNFSIPVTINNESPIPAFSKLKSNKQLQDFILKNSLKIKEKAYQYYVNYYNNLPAEELKTCCPDDFNNFNKVKKIKNLSSLDIEKNLGMYIDYESITITIVGNQKYKPIVFTKTNEEINSDSDEQQAVTTTQPDNKCELGKLSDKYKFVLEVGEYKNEKEQTYPISAWVIATNKKSGKSQEIHFEPNSWAAYSSLPCNSFFVKDFNFDGLEDFAIVWDQGGAEKLYEYYFQDEKGNFTPVESFPLQHGMLAENIDTTNKTITTQSIVGCCHINLNKYKLNTNGTWETSSEQRKVKRN